MTNKYVSFISDEDFINCVKYVIDAYQLEKIDNIEKMLKHGEKLKKIDKMIKL